MINKLQANILKSHGRSHSCHLAIKIKDSSKEKTILIRKWIRHLGQQLVTSHSQQLKDTEKYNEDKSNQVPVYTFAISYQGYKKLMIPKPLIPSDISFRDSMLHTNKDLNILNDYNATNLDFNLYKLDFILSVAHQNRFALELAIDQLKSAIEFEQIKDNIYYSEHYGYKLKDEQTNTVTGPLGFVDGLSEVRDFVSVVNATLTKEPGEGDFYGSYMVFRKTKTNRTYFDEFCQGKDIAAEYPTLTPEYIAAMIVGRFRNGTPLIHHNLPKPAQEWSKKGIDNPFSYKNDPKGYICPIHSHVRAFNPRTGKEPLPIIRRSMNYKEEQPDEEGLLFISYQKSLNKQFIAIAKKVSKDNLLYHQEKLSFPESRGSTATGDTISSVGKFTEIRGGDYFFCPSLAFLQGVEEFDYE